MCMKTPKPPAPPALPPLVPTVDKAPAPKLNEAAKVDNMGIRKKRGTKALRIDLTAPQGGSGLNI